MWFNCTGYFHKEKFEQLELLVSIFFLPYLCISFMFYGFSNFKKKMKETKFFPKNIFERKFSLLNSQVIQLIKTL